MSRVRVDIVMSVCVLAMPAAGCKEDENSNTNAFSTPWFVDITDEVGLEFTYETGFDGKYHFAEIMGGAVAMFDYNNDGLLDIYLTNGHRSLPKLRASEAIANRLFAQTPTGSFEEVTDIAGVGDTGYAMGATIGDFNNDGHLDLFVTNYGPDRLFLNRGDGTFDDVTDAAQVAGEGWSSSAAFVDIDRDGLLDLYVVRYLEVNAAKICSDPLGRTDYCSPRAFYPYHDLLYRNNGDCTFSDVSVSSGIAAVKATGLGVVCEDFNDDGWIDIYVTNDSYPNQLWINRKDGTFRDEAVIRGVAFNLNGLAEAGMGVVAADFDRDGDSDLFMTHLRHESNTLYMNLGGGNFADLTGQMGLATAGLPYTGFGIAAFDLELDGDLDLFIVNGAVVRRRHHAGVAMGEPWASYAEPNLLYLGDGQGRFVLSTGPEGEALWRPVEVSRGLASGDIDNDGDVDLLVANIGSPPRLYRNDVPRTGHWLGIRAVRGVPPRDAIGARLAVACGSHRYLRTIRAAYSYQSGNDLRAHFGLGDCFAFDRVDVRWPDGTKESFPGGAADRYLIITKGSGRKSP